MRESYDSGIEDHYRKQIELKGKPLHLIIGDDKGTFLQTFNPLAITNPFIDGFVILYSITEASTLENVNSYFKCIETYLKNHEKNVKFPIVLVGNKLDLEESRQVSFLQGKKKSEEFPGCRFFESSAKMDVNINEVFYCIAEDIHEFKEQNVKTQESNSPKKDCSIM
jgi:GTPase SAR1 family protein